MNTADLDAIEAALQAGEIPWQECWAKLKALPNPWGRREWKDRRATMLGPSCMQCGRSEGSLVVQHMSRPPSLGTIIRNVAAADRRAYEEANPITWKKAESVPRQGCPKCGAVTVYYRKRANTWVCRGKVNHRSCDHVFDEPVEVMAPTKETRAVVQSIGSEATQARWEDFKEESYVRHGPIAVQLLIGHWRRYLAFEDAVTFCERCAFLWDKEKMRLCTVCRIHFHDFSYPTCFECSGRPSMRPPTE